MPVGHDPEFTEFARAAQTIGLNITPETYGQLCRYAQLIREYNQKINLVSRQDTHRIFTYHIIDSLAAHSFIPQNARCCDLGSGAGFPGIPLALIRPDTAFILIESIKKKCRFLEIAVKELNLKNCSIYCERAETVPPLNCDVILSRLTAPLEKTLHYAAPHLKPGGAIVLYKTGNWQAEIEKKKKVINRYNLQLKNPAIITLPFSEIERHFLLFIRN
ncbi:MAG: 16S rRNA (guanine(527)-N(7))-methyltransferase RsmG [candidate division WOR-3 bacterium]|nr:16S rRNA (guanine(527)-N(7))-methyltransferase RsmG [candidate division WOR-3 bacterium]MDH7519435.1 16S rRNA (guanine(527)-N(7))-methyltransferase RsmG [bacterium]